MLERIRASARILILIIGDKMKPIGKKEVLFLLIPFLCTACSTGKTDAKTISNEVPDRYLQERKTKKGRIETFTYETRDYALGSFKTAEKDCNVYLPYGYDGSKQYNILYLIHGTDKQDVDHINTWFETIKARVILDNLIYYKEIDPLIVVTPTFYSYQLYGDDTAQNIKDYSPVKEHSNQNFISELRLDLVPSVEKKYHTFADKTTDEKSLAGSRNHRAIAGLSNGCRLTLSAGMKNSFDYFSYYGCYSSYIDGKELLDSLHQEKFKGLKLNYMFNADGIYDFAYNGHRKMVDYLLENGQDIFTEENTEYVKVDMGYHSARSWRVGLFDSLLCFFKESK